MCSTKNQFCRTLWLVSPNNHTCGGGGRLSGRLPRPRDSVLGTNPARVQGTRTTKRRTLLGRRSPRRQRRRPRQYILEQQPHKNSPQFTQCFLRLETPPFLVGARLSTTTTCLLRFAAMPAVLPNRPSFPRCCPPGATARCCCCFEIPWRFSAPSPPLAPFCQGAGDGGRESEPWVGMATLLQTTVVNHQPRAVVLPRQSCIPGI